MTSDPMNRRDFLGRGVVTAATTTIAGNPASTPDTTLVDALVEAKRNNLREAWGYLSSLHTNPTSIGVQRYITIGKKDASAFLGRSSNEVRELKQLVARIDKHVPDDYRIVLNASNDFGVTLKEIKTALQNWGTPEAIAEKAANASQQAIANYETVKAWMQKRAETYPGNGMLDNYVRDDHHPMNMLGDMTNRCPDTFGSPTVTEALTLPDSDPRKYELLKGAFTHPYYGETTFKPEVAMPSKMADEYVASHNIPRPFGRPIPKAPKNPTTLETLQKVLAGVEIHYNPTSNLYETNLKTTFGNLPRLRVLLQEEDEELGGLKIKQKDGAIVHHDAELTYPHFGTICLDERAAQKLAEYVDIVPLLDKAQALAGLHNPTHRSR